MHSSTLLWGFLFGTIGFSYFLYGRKRSNLAVILAGLSLIIYPYFFESTIALVGIGIALMLSPRFVRF